jgi:hypothetical protein
VTNAAYCKYSCGLLWTSLALYDLGYYSKSFLAVEKARQGKAKAIAILLAIPAALLGGYLR